MSGWSIGEHNENGRIFLYLDIMEDWQGQGSFETLIIIDPKNVKKNHIETLLQQVASLSGKWLSLILTYLSLLSDY